MNSARSWPSPAHTVSSVSHLRLRTSIPANEQLIRSLAKLELGAALVLPACEQTTAAWCESSSFLVVAKGMARAPRLPRCSLRRKLTRLELAAADGFEVADHTRAPIVLESGFEAWGYGTAIERRQGESAKCGLIGSPTSALGNALDAMTAVTRPRLIDQVLGSLLSQIQSSGLGPGDALPRERELATELGVSRSMIRQAFRVLEDRGIVTSRQGSGRYLRVADGENPDVPHALEIASIVDILETRMILERNGVALACERRTAAEAALILQRARTLTSWQDNMAFHVAIASATHNFMLERLVRQQTDLGDQLHQRGNYVDPTAVEAMKAEHTAIAEAIMNRDAESASRLMDTHLRQTSKVVLASQRHSDVPSEPGD